MAQHEELSIPSLDLIQPGACKDVAACDKLRDAIAGECEALLMRFESEKEVCSCAHNARMWARALYRV